MTIGGLPADRRRHSVRLWRPARHARAGLARVRAGPRRRQRLFVDRDFFAGEEPPSPDEVRFPPRCASARRSSALRFAPEPPGPFISPPRPLVRRWFAVDLPAMGRNAGLENVADYYVANAYVGADGRATPNPFALAPGADALPPARHMGYAITWYGLALVLLVIYFAYHGSVGRLALKPPRQRED
ncbi:MAG: hypothetical protein IPG56_06135 [Caulobacteraceae bacterium]|nr:hypothetical protein [Caulobacteraceae bacterium]